MTSLVILTLMVCLASYTEAKLKFLQVVFRHGDRAPDSNGLEEYPSDPYRDVLFGSVQRGRLTKEGKMREYTLGVYLRKTYDDFLGDTYITEEVNARSTNLDRTKTSLQLVLAGLYPPKNEQLWNPVLAWQPIPATHVHGLDDNLMVPEECPLYLMARERVEQSFEFKKKLESFRTFMRYLSDATQMPITDSNQMYFLYHTLMAQKALNLSLPEWTRDIFPKGKLLDGINLEYEIFSYNIDMKRLNGGMFIKKFTDDMVNWDKKRKLNLYSGHETNIAAILQALGVYKPHVPEYSSAIFIELHEDNNEYYVKAKYYKGIPPEHIDLYIPGCGFKCTLRQFRNATRNVYPSDLETICDKRSLGNLLKNSRIQIAPGIVKQVLTSIRKEEETKSKLLE